MKKLGFLFFVVFLYFVSSAFAAPSFSQIQSAACELANRMQTDVSLDACPGDACLRNLVKPKRVCEWRLEGVMAACDAGNSDQARTKLLAAYNPVRNHIGQMLHHCRAGQVPCGLVASYIGGEFLDEFYLVQDYPGCPNSFSCLRDELWGFGDSGPPLLSPSGANDLNLLGWMKARLNQSNVCE